MRLLVLSIAACLASMPAFAQPASHPSQAEFLAVANPPTTADEVSRVGAECTARFAAQGVKAVPDFFEQEAVAEKYRACFKEIAKRDGLNIYTVVK